MSKKPGGGSRDLTVRVKSAQGRKKSSTKWLQRQLNDPYVAQAKRDGYRSRAAYKLIELDEKYKLLRPGMRVLDLGAAPGGWTQVAIARLKGKGSVLGVDLLAIDPLADVQFMQLDFLSDEAPELIRNALGGPADLVMSDMAANTTGHTATDHLRIMTLCELAYHFASEILSVNGAFICKVLKGGTENDLLKLMKQDFATVRHAKPQASRQDSAESYVVAQGFRGKTR